MPEKNNEIETLRNAYRQDPENKDTAIRLAQKYADQGWLNESIVIYKKLIKIYTSDFPLLLEYGNICFSRQSYREAAKIFKKLTVLKPKRVEGWNNLGIVQLALKDFEAAKRSFKNVLAVEPENHGALMNMGNYYDHVDDRDKAIDLFKRATAARPDFPDAWFNLGNALLTKGLYRKAVDAYEKSLKYNPKFFSAYKNIGFAYEQLGRYEKAEEFYNKAMALNKTDSALYVNIATIYTKQEHYDKAKDFFLRAVKLSPKDAAGWLGLRDLSLRKGDIKTYVKSTCAILHRLDGSKIAESLCLLRKMQHHDDIDIILKSVDTLNIKSRELDGERMISCRRNEADRLRASLLYKRLQGIPNPSDHLLNCLAGYCFQAAQYEKTINYIEAMHEKTSDDLLLQWKALIDSDGLQIAEALIKKHLKDDPDCFDGWFQLARIKAKTEDLDAAREYIVNALETGFANLDILDDEPELKTIYESLSHRADAASK